MSRFVSVRVGFLVAAALVGTCGAAPRRVVARDWHVPAEAATIQAAVDSAVAGDVVVLAAGTYSDCTELNGNGVAHIAILRNGIHLRGATGDPADVVLDAEPVIPTSALIQY